MIPALLALALTQSLAPAQSGAGEIARYVVVVGHNGAGSKARRPLRFADDDAARLYLQLLPTARRGWLLTTFDEESARAFVDLTDVARAPTLKELARVFGEVTWALREEERRGVETELVFFFAGHGDVDPGGEGFLVLADGPFTRTDLETQVVAGSVADTTHVILDACASYFMVARGDAESGGRPLSPELLDVLEGRSAKVEAAYLKTGVLVSTSDAAEVHETAELGGGVFSYLLRSALAGGADVDGDGDVEYAEAAAFIAAASQRIDDPRARLKVHARAPAQRPHAPLVDYPTSGVKHFLSIGPRGPKRVQLFDARGQPYAEVHRQGSAPVRLALVGNPFFIVRVGEKEAVLVPRRAGAYALSSLRFEDALEPRSTRSPRFHALFFTPFDEAFVDGFVASGALLPPRRDAPFTPAFAPGAEEPFRVPWAGLGLSSLVGASLFGGLAIIATLGNAMAFSDLSKSYEATRAVDPEIAFRVEAWRTAAVASTAGAVVLGLIGGSLLGVELFAEEEAP